MTLDLAWCIFIRRQVSSHDSFDIIRFYLDSGQTEMKDEYEKFSNDMKGIFRIGSVNCSQYQKICDKEGVKDTPVVRLYPPFPAPT